ncbi:MAG: helix-turn-helix domain-containing protein [Oscillospiraceae bacterium]|nr:helix-turn-helix domain-containing protein [Oscillospiraceae bacterium]
MHDMEELCKLARSFPLTEGENKTGLPYLSIYLSREKEAAMPRTDSFYIYAVIAGSLRLHTPSGILDYMPGQYSISKIDTPTSGHILTFSQQGDFLAAAVELSLHDVISVLLDLDGSLAEQIAGSTLDDAVTRSSDRHVLASIQRMLSVTKEPAQLPFMGKHIKRELIFFILCGSCGSQFLQSVANIQQAGEIYEINSWIKAHFRDSFTVEELADMRNMSVSLFHQKFKHAVGMGPLQCQKRLRLTEARRLMLDENRNVTEASLEVGYESVSQFTREYRKMFGTKPKEDILKLRGQLEKQVNFS